MVVSPLVAQGARLLVICPPRDAGRVKHKSPPAAAGYSCLLDGFARPTADVNEAEIRLMAGAVGTVAARFPWTALQLQFARSIGQPVPPLSTR